MKRLRIIWLVFGFVLAFMLAQTQHLSQKPHQDPKPEAAVAALSEQEATAQIQALAKSNAPIKLSRHAKERMEQRQFTIDDIRTALREGVVKNPPRLGDRGDWIYKIEDEDTRGKKDGEVVLIIDDNQLFIVTVMWDGEDVPSQKK